MHAAIVVPSDSEPGNYDFLWLFVEGKWGLECDLTHSRLLLARGFDAFPPFFKREYRIWKLIFHEAESFLKFGMA